MRTISRRQFGYALGASAFFSGVVAAMRGREARAAGAPAENLVVVTTGDGCIPEDFHFDSILKPLAAHQPRMLVLRGAVFTDAARNTNHNGAEVVLRGDGIGIFGGASLDHYVARAKRSTDLNGNAFGLVVPMTDDAPGTTQSRVSYDKTDSIASFPHTPAAGFRKLFGAVDPGARNDKTFIDLAVSELGSIRAPLGASERIKVDGCIESLHRLEQQAIAPPKTLRCDRPLPPSTIDTIASDQFVAVTKAQIDLAVLALECGITNVLTLQFAEDQSFVPVFQNVAGVMTVRSQHEAAHVNDGSFLAIQSWYSAQCAYLLDALAAKNLLDRTLVFRAFDFGRGDHQSRKLTFVPFFLAGATGALAGGRELDVPPAGSHHAVLATVCAAMGVPVPQGAAPIAGALLG